MQAIKKATEFVLAEPEQAWKEIINFKPMLSTDLDRRIFERSFAYFSKDLKNVQRDWTKVTKYGKRLGVLDQSFEPNYTNKFLTWTLDHESADPTGDQKKMCALQSRVATGGGFYRL